MTEAFPGQHTTTTTVTQSNTTVQTDIRYDPFYIRTIPGMLKAAQIILNLLGFLTISVSGYSSLGRGSFFSSISGFGFWFTGILLVLYVFHVVEKFFAIPWLRIELVYCALWAVFYMIASTLCAANMSYSAAFACTALFGYCAMGVYGYDAFLKFKAVKSGEIAQGERHVAKTTSTVTSPAY
ncbi:proteolipid protein 2 isoform X1 [Nilaparvata lugens]|uniref:proteolipid protein 2 isoform X2 n=1 Tax=Nilaparvata lugens TaxID=108931 RepID=UPI000B98EB7B|nr:proteolipid protein 2 isoform X2 [Nilaparvata lugens]XP_039280025.1 proteolipid protein 2 isoform X1 [Nilaparvata lugens]